MIPNSSNNDGGDNIIWLKHKRKSRRQQGGIRREKEELPVPQKAKMEKVADVSGNRYRDGKQRMRHYEEAPGICWLELWILYELHGGHNNTSDGQGERKAGDRGAKSN